MDRRTIADVRPPASGRAVAPVFVAVVWAVAIAGCGSSDDSSVAIDRSAGGVTTTTVEVEAAADLTDDRYPDGLRGVRYCEVLLLSRVDAGFQAEVWNTMGLGDCPQEEWAQLDSATIAAERGAIAAVLNGPRYWTLDTIVSDLRDGAPDTTFGSIGMFRAATVELGETPPDQTPYTERRVARETVFGFRAGSEVHELTDPAGTTYVMQSYSLIVDPTLTSEALASLDLDLPEGWSYTTRILAEDLDLLSTEGFATVVQDEFQNTYQRNDSGEAP